MHGGMANVRAEVLSLYMVRACRAVSFVVGRIKQTSLKPSVPTLTMRHQLLRFKEIAFHNLMKRATAHRLQRSLPLLPLSRCLAGTRGWAAGDVRWDGSGSAGWMAVCGPETLLVVECGPAAGPLVDTWRVRLRSSSRLECSDGEAENDRRPTHEITTGFPAASSTVCVCVYMRTFTHSPICVPFTVIDVQNHPTAPVIR